MDFTVIDASGDYSHIVLAGRLDPHETTRIRDRFRAETVEKDRPAIVDLSGVTFITSVALGLLVDCADTLRRAGHSMVFVRAEGHVNEVFRKTGIYAIVAAVDTPEEARARINGADAG